MVEVGSISVGGNIDTSNIERGQKRVKDGFEDVKASGKSVGSDMTRMTISVGRLAGNLIKLGGVGAGAFVALAKGAPAVAPAMAQISVQTDRLKRVLGEALQPTFDKFAKAYTKFVDFVQQHPDLTQGFVLSAGALAGIAALNKLLGISVSAGLLTALKWLFSAPAAGSAIATGATIAGLLILFDKLSDILAKQEGMVPNAVPEVTQENIQKFYFGPGLKGQGTTPMPFPQVAPGQGINTTMSMDQEENRRAWLLQNWDAQWG